MFLYFYAFRLLVHHLHFAIWTVRHPYIGQDRFYCLILLKNIRYRYQQVCIPLHRQNFLLWHWSIFRHPYIGQNRFYCLILLKNIRYRYQQVCIPLHRQNFLLWHWSIFPYVIIFLSFFYKENCLCFLYKDLRQCSINVISLDMSWCCFADSKALSRMISMMDGWNSLTSTLTKVQFFFSLIFLNHSIAPAELCPLINAQQFN